MDFKESGMENSMSQISVIIPVYNVEKYLPVCVESVMAQTFEDIEIILVDDGSTDACPQICDKYALSDARIKVIHKLNGGVASARQAGFESATGKYVFCVDSDDCMHPDTLATLYKISLDTGADVVQCDLRVIEEEDTESIYELHEKGIHTLSRYQAYCVVEQNDEKFGHNSRLVMTVIWGKLIKAEILQKVIPIENLRVHEDQMLISRLLSVMNQLVFVETDYYYYRNRKGSIMKSSWNPERLVMLDVYKNRMCIVSDLQNVSVKEREILRQLVFRRYMISIIRNYIIVSSKVEKKQATEMKKTLHRRFAYEMAEFANVELARKDKILFALFSGCPFLGASVYKILKRREL